MNNTTLSYAEAYTDFLKYCSKKENKGIDTLIQEFRGNNIEKNFRLIYESDKTINNIECYKIIRGSH
jgi:hypothetical protein